MLATVLHSGYMVHGGNAKVLATSPHQHCRPPATTPCVVWEYWRRQPQTHRPEALCLWTVATVLADASALLVNW
jgi:hypothetical protein